jgi:L-ribulose-5-phosphate 3-epimerase
MRPSHRLGACSWSLQPRSPDDLGRKLRLAGLHVCQLHLDPVREGLWKLDQVLALRDGGIEVRSGMMTTRGEDYTSLESIRATGGVRPTEHWNENLERARGDADVAAKLGIELVSFHAGFLPEDRRDRERATMIERLRAVIDVFGERGIDVAFETGQESAATLAGVLEELDRPRAGVNFDPANLLLYDADEPIDALRALVGRVRQVHVKDAVRTAVPGTWGREVPAGTGEVEWEDFFDVLGHAGRVIDLMIEREAGEDRVGDIVRARELVSTHVKLKGAR